MKFLYIIAIVVFISESLFSKTLFLDNYDKGEISLKKGFATSITFEEEVKTIFLGDTISYKSDISGDKKIVGLWVIGEGKGTNMLVLTDKNQYNFVIKEGAVTPLFYFVKYKAPVSKKDIIIKSLIKDRDIIERATSYKTNKQIVITFYDRENFKDSLYVNLRFKIKYSGSDFLQMLPDEIVLSQNGKVLPILFKNYDNSAHILTLTAEERKPNERIRVQVPFAFGKEKMKCVSLIVI